MEIKTTEQKPVGIVVCVVCGYGIDVDGAPVVKAVIERKKHDPRRVVTFSFIEQHVYYTHPHHSEEQVKAAVEKAEVALKEAERRD